MPEFMLNTEGAGQAWEALDGFAKGFIEAAFFSETSCYDSAEFFEPKAQEAIAEGQADGNIPEDSGTGDIDSASLERVKEFCAEFQKQAAALLSEAYSRDYTEEQAGRDLYFTFAGHGVGYWDRDELSNADLGDRLSEACGRGEINLSAYESEDSESGFFVEFYIG